MRRFVKIFASIAVVLIIVFAGFFVWAYRPVPSFEPHAYEPVPLGQWPTAVWERSTPESQGMNSETLLEMATFVKDEIESDPEFFLDSITIIRGGHIVAEIYPNPNFSRDEPHVIHSTTKSIVSVLIGIAIDDGLIKSADTKLVDFFPEESIQHLDQRKREITIRDLLTMQTGLHSRDSYLYGHEGLLALQQSDDWLAFALDLPMAVGPGTRFDYSNISTFLLGAVLTRATGTDVLSYARIQLFDPLGIENVSWEWTKDCLPIAWARMWLKPNDFAKIGLLYLQQGQWDGRQIVSTAWIKESLTPWAFPRNAVEILNADMTPNHEASTRNWVAQRFIRPFADGYGYQWWLDRAGNYTALGTNGQYMIVAPVHNLIFVVTGKSRGVAQFKPSKLFHNFVLPAVEADSPRAPNVAASTALAVLSEPPARRVDIVASTALPKIAQSVSGVTYQMEKNPYKTDNVQFVFRADEPVAKLSYNAREDWMPEFQIGLDGRPRVTKTSDRTYIASGIWTAPDTLEVNVEIVGYTTFDKWQFHFRDGTIAVTEHSITGVYSYEGQAVSQ